MAPQPAKKEKTAKAQKAELDRIIAALELENKELHTTQSQKILFGTTAGWVALAPLYMFGSGLIEAKLKESALVLILGTLATALVLYYIMDVQTAKTRFALVKKADFSSARENEEAIVHVKRALSNQAVYYALWTTSLCYFVLFATFFWYCFADYELSPPVKSSISSLLSSGLVAVLISTGAL